MGWEEYLTVRDLMNYMYCPRIVFFERVLKIPQATTVKEYKGRKYHKKFNRNSKRAKITDEFEGYSKKYDVLLEDKELGFRTVLDCLLIDEKNNAAYILQVKDSVAPKIIYRTHKFQLFAEAYLAKKLLGVNIKGAYIKYLQDSKLVNIRLDEVYERGFVSTLNAIRKMIQEEIMPPPVEYYKRCSDCCFTNLCRRI